MIKTLIPALAMLAVALTGCESPCELGPAKGVVMASVNSMGGLKAWQKVDEIRADAVVTSYNDKGEAFVNRQRQVIDINNGEIAAEAVMGNGSWKAEVESDGRVQWEAQGLSDVGGLSAREAQNLRTILHRVRGPLNLACFGERPTAVAKVDVLGKPYFRVPVRTNPSGVRAYYFDAVTNALAMVTTGADVAGGKGTVTLYTYRMEPNGLAFPSRIAVMKIGHNVLVGDEPVLEVEYKDVKID